MSEDYFNDEMFFKSSQPKKPVEEQKETNDGEQAPNRKQLSLGILLGIGYLFCFALVPYIILTVIFGSPTYEGAENVMSSVAQLITAVAVILVYFALCKDKLKGMLKGFKFAHIFKALGYALLVYVAAVFLSNLDLMLFGESEVNANQQSIDQLFGIAPLPAILLTCIVAPIIEEFIFRYFVFKPLEKKNLTLAFIVSGLAFAGVHMISTISAFIDTGDAQTLWNDLRSFPQYFASGLLFCWIYYKTRHLYMNILSHMIYNTIATALLFFAMSTDPLKMKNIKTYSDGVSFELQVNSIYQDSFEITRISIVDANTNEVSVETLTDLIQDTYTFDGLESNKQYFINIDYEYVTNNGFEDVEEEGTYSTYFYTIPN